MRLTTLAALFAAFFLFGCSALGPGGVAGQTGPGVPECGDSADIPKAAEIVQQPKADGGLKATSAPGAYDGAGVTNPNVTVGRGTGATTSTSTYGADKSNAGALAVNQAWQADSNAAAVANALKKAPPSVVACQRQIELLQMRSASLPPGSDQQADLDNRIEALINTCATLNSSFFASLAKLAPNYENATLVQLVLAGSAVNGKAVDPQNAEKAAAGVPAALEKIGGIKAAQYGSEVEDTPAEEGK